MKLSIKEKRYSKLYEWLKELKVLVWFNGKLVPKDKIKIDMFDRGFMYGDGVFESLRTYNGKPFMLDEHLKRLYKAAKRVSIKAPDLRTAVLRTIKANGFDRSYIKIIVTRGVAGGHGLDISNVLTKPTAIVMVDRLKDYPADTYMKGWRAVITDIRRGDTLADIKTLNYANNILAKLEASRQKANEAIMLTNKGFLAEGTVSNLFFVKRGTIYTPSVKTGILEGITRDVVLKIARRSGIRAAEGFYKARELYSADESFITSSSSGIVPIVSVDGKKIGSGKPGMITRRLMELYERKIG
jgi:branched-chain amino acid aminotransferase